MDKTTTDHALPADAAFNEIPDATSVPAPSTSHRNIGYVALIWGLGGIVAVFSMAIVRLLAISIDAFGFTLSWTHWLVFLSSVLFMAYAEGYRTFQKTWAPRVVERAFTLKDQWTPITLLLAPFYCMSFFRATKKRYLTAWITTVCIVMLVILMNRIAQPWRGLVDAGVVVGLSWGIASIVLLTLSRLTKPANKTNKIR